MAHSDRPSILIYGYGNPGRTDDGVGIAFTERINAQRYPAVSTESNYQLNAEDALAISENDIVVFVDASQKETVEHFRFYAIEPAHEITFTTHAMMPQSIVALCQELYGRKPDAYMLEIRGYAWEMSEQLSSAAGINLDKAFGFMNKLLENPSQKAFAEAALQYKK